MNDQPSKLTFYQWLTSTLPRNLVPELGKLLRTPLGEATSGAAIALVVWFFQGFFLGTVGTIMYLFFALPAVIFLHAWYREVYEP